LKSHRNSVAFFGALFMLACIGAINARIALDYRALSEKRAQVRRLLFEVQRLFSVLQDAESGQRGFLLTGDERHLERYRAARATLDTHLAAIDRLDDAHHASTFNLDAVRPLITEKLHLLAEGIAAYREEGVEAAMRLVRSGRGKQVMDEFRRVMGRQRNELELLLDASVARSNASSRKALLALAVGGTGSLAVMLLCYVWLRREVAGRRRSEAALHASEARQRQLSEQLTKVFHSSPDGICAFDAEGRFVQASAACESLWGYSPGELLGTPYIEKVLPEDRPRTIEAASAIMAGKPTRAFENCYRRKDGSTVHIMWSAQWSDTDQIMFCVARDVTELRRTQEEAKRRTELLERTTAELAAAKERAEAADRLKSAFLATMSHELRTPLNSIIGFTGIILQGLAGPLNPEQAKQLEMVRGSARHLLALINDVLDVSKIEAGQLEVYHEPFDLGASIVHVTNTVRPLAAKKGLALNVEVSPAVGQVISDKRRVEQVLLNLLSNAVKFTEHGGPSGRRGRSGRPPVRDRYGPGNRGQGPGPVVPSVSAD
jgi:PAS domain S-box-containing protein